MPESSIVRRQLVPFLGSVHKARLGSFFVAAEALIRGGQLTGAAVGRAIGGRVADKHNIKRIDRLLGNTHLSREIPLFYRAIAHAVLGGQRRPILLVDWTAVDEGMVALSAAVAIGGRAIPVYTEAHPQKHLGKAWVHRRFLRTLRDRILPEDCCPIVVTDAGFITPWFAQVVELGWSFVGRVSSYLMVVEYGLDAKQMRRRDAWTRVKTLHGMASTEALDLGVNRLSRQSAFPARVVLIKDPPRGRKGSKKVNRRGIHPGATAYKNYQRREREPWVLATSEVDVAADRIVAWYRSRMQIEETFRDAKNHRWGWSLEDARSRSPQRWQVLLLLAAVALLAVTLVGLLAEAHGKHRGFQANTLRSRRVVSWFVLGRLTLRRRGYRPLSLSAQSKALALLRRAADQQSQWGTIRSARNRGDP